MIDPVDPGRFRRDRQAARRRFLGGQPRRRPTRPGSSPSPPTAGRSPTTPGTERRRRGPSCSSTSPSSRGCAGRDEAGRHQGARRAEPARLPDAARRRRAAQDLPMVLIVHGGPWGRDSWGYNPDGPVVRQPRLRLPAGQLPRLDRLRQGVPERRQQAVGQGDARRPDRRLQLGRRAGLRRPQEDRRSSAALTAATPRWPA